MENYLTTEEVTHQLDISESTLKNWVKMFQLKPERGPRNKKRYDVNTYEVLKTVKNLRDEERGFDTIRKVITQDETTQVAVRQQPGTQLIPTQQESVMDKQELVSEVIKAIQEQTALSEKYARATYTIGQLEAEKKGLENQIKSIREELGNSFDKISKLKKNWFVRMFLSEYV